LLLKHFLCLSIDKRFGAFLVNSPLILGDKIVSFLSILCVLSDLFFEPLCHPFLSQFRLLLFNGILLLLRAVILLHFLCVLPDETLKFITIDRLESHWSLFLFKLNLINHLGKGRDICGGGVTTLIIVIFYCR
jgi:hypothetical protein